MSFRLEQNFFSPSSYRKARPVSAAPGGVHSQSLTQSLTQSQSQSQQRRRLAHSQPSSGDSLDGLSGDMRRKSEKEILQALNDRFAGYIDKVRHLEMHNRNLEAEAEALRRNQSGRSSVGDQYEGELGELRAELQHLTGERARAAAEHEHLEDDVHHLHVRLDEETRHREELEAAARAINKYAEECRLARADLDKKLAVLEEEADFLRSNHQEEVDELLAQIHGAQTAVDPRDGGSTADLTSALRDIRAQLDSQASVSATHAEEWFKVRVDRLSEAARSNQDAIRGTQEELFEYRRQLQNRSIEMETLRGTKESLERQRAESEDSHQEDLHSLQDTIQQLDHQLKTTKWEMASQLRDYQELLNVKMALDIEIAAYRKLLEGEESRCVSVRPSFSYVEGRMSGALKMKGEEIIVEEQMDETQVTEVTEEEDDEEEEEEEEEDKKEEEEEEEGKKEAEDDKEEEEEADEEEEKSSSKTEAPSPKTAETNSPAAKASPPKSPEPEKEEPKEEEPKEEEPRAAAAKTTLKEEKKEEEPKDKEEVQVEKKESKPEPEPKKEEESKPAPPNKAPTNKSGPPESPQPAKDKSGPPESPQPAKDKSGPPESPQPAKDKSGPSESPQPAKDKSGPSESPQPAKDKSGPSESPQPAKDKSGPSESPQPAKDKSGPSESPPPAKDKSSSPKAPEPKTEKEEKKPEEKSASKPDQPEKKITKEEEKITKEEEKEEKKETSKEEKKEEKKPEEKKPEEKSALKPEQPEKITKEEEKEEKKEKKEASKEEKKEEKKEEEKKEVKEGGKTEKSSGNASK